jgi:hypothetical protein
MATILIHISLATGLMNVSGHQKKGLKRNYCHTKGNNSNSEGYPEMAGKFHVFQTSFSCFQSQKSCC